MNVLENLQIILDFNDMMFEAKEINLVLMIAVLTVCEVLELLNLQYIMSEASLTSHS